MILEMVTSKKQIKCILVTMKPNSHPELKPFKKSLKRFLLENVL